MILKAFIVLWFLFVLERLIFARKTYKYYTKIPFSFNFLFQFDELSFSIAFV